MAWVLIDDNFPNHPKAVQAGPLGRDLFVSGLCYCRRFYTGGVIPVGALLSLGVVNPKRLAGVLVSVGLWDVVDGGYQIHDYEAIYADGDDKQRRVTNQKKGRKGGIESRRLNTIRSSGSGNGTGDLSVQLLEEKRDADFANFWQAYPKKDGRQAAHKAWVKLQPDDDTQRIIAADIARRAMSAQWLKDGGQFIPMGSTYLNGRRWEDGFVERPRLAERTINVIKGFESPGEEIA